MMSAISPACLDAFREPLLLVRSSGVIAALNGPAGRIFGPSADPSAEVSLCQITSLIPAEAEKLIHDCLATNEPIPFRLPMNPAESQQPSLRCEGWRCEVGTEAAILIRIRMNSERASRFSELTRLVDELNRECLARQQSEEKLRAALEQLHDINNIRDHMLSQVSHDLRTPLNAILGMTEFMRSEPFGALGEKYKDYIEDVHASGELLLELVDQVLNLTTDDAGKRDKTTEALVDLSECLENCRRVVEPIARLRGLEILIPADIALPKLRADQLLVKQILMNLLGNAAKYTNRGGRIEVSVEWEDGLPLAIRVRDTGPGIAEDRLAAIKGDDLASSAYVAGDGKSGFGLALSRRTAKAIGGELDIQSVVGGGTVASLVLPTELVASGAAGA